MNMISYESSPNRNVDTSDTPVMGTREQLPRDNSETPSPPNIVRHPRIAGTAFNALSYASSEGNDLDSSAVTQPISLQTPHVDLNRNVYNSTRYETNLDPKYLIRRPTRRFPDNTPEGARQRGSNAVNTINRLSSHGRRTLPKY